MGRIREYIKVDGKNCWTLFDSGARNTYVTSEVASMLATTKLPRPFKSALGGKVRKASTAALLVAQIEGHNISTNAMVVNEIGKDEDRKPIEILFGALAMQQWGIRSFPPRSGSTCLTIPRSLWNSDEAPPETEEVRRFLVRIRSAHGSIMAYGPYYPSCDSHPWRMLTSSKSAAQYIFFHCQP